MEKLAEFLDGDIHNWFPQLDFACLWKKGAAPAPARVVQLYGTNRADCGGHWPRPKVVSLAEFLRPTGPLRYPSRVCSNNPDAIDRIAEAIDQLASDAQGEASGQELATRVADLWLMVSAIDPELARRKQHYTASADGTSSS